MAEGKAGGTQEVEEEAAMSATHIAYIDHDEEVHIEELSPGETPEQAAGRLNVPPCRKWWAIPGEEVEMEKERIAAAKELKAVMEELEDMGRQGETLN